ncbi:cell envelope integrity protein TolA [Massilia aerilata]|uniref:Cell envelope integrity protein TolA n=1 Tax=Massilia aerilata TaxID=453817 RepID=A0ABW0S268_9BURK
MSSIGLAVGVHALLLAFLVIGINWTNNQPIAVEAEVWDTSVQQAAPPAPQPPPQVEPEPEPQPETPPPTPRVVEPPPVAEPAPPKQPDIALEREKKRKQEQKRKEEERVEREQEIAKQKREEEKKEKALAEKKAREDQKKKEQELAKKEEEAQKKKEKAEKEKAEKLAKAKAEKAEADKREKARADEMKRLMSGAGNPGSSGNAAKSTAPRIDQGYLASLAAQIKSNTSYPGSTDVPGNPEVVFQVEQLPTGEILSVRKVKSSGIPAFDDAVERGINKSSPLRKKKDGTVERSLPVSFKLKDLN